MQGISFKSDMIKAIVEGRKTVTRRVIKLPDFPENFPEHKQPSEWNIRRGINVWITENTKINYQEYCKPRYQVGEVVYIKEAWQVLDMDTRTLRQPIHRVKAEYKLDGFRTWTKMPATIAYTIPDRWHSPLHLAEITARYFIRIKDVRAERLQEITEEEAKAEGVTRPPNYSLTPYYREWFRYLWDTIHKKEDRWEDNPWVFRYQFELVEASHEHN